MVSSMATKFELTWKCGHHFEVPRNVSSAPMCPQCGERKITDVKAPPPRIRGHAMGPHVKTEFIGGRAVSVGSKGPLIKDASD